MFTIGDFARHGQVSPRMLRHYDAIGLLRPAHTDPYTGYRRYSAAQLAPLNRIIALKDLGFTLEQVSRILREHPAPEELRAMLTLRRAELERTMAETAARLAQVEARLRSIESEGHMPVDEVIVKSVPATRVAELTATAPSFAPEDIGAVINPLYAELFRRLEAAGIEPSGPGIAYYEDLPATAATTAAAPEGGGAVVVHASVTVATERRAGLDVTIVDLPAVERAATIVHRGRMDAVMPSVQALLHWVEQGGHRMRGHTREVNLECPRDKDSWVTEIQAELV
ncbi:MerR family transcriptional regulator [Streptomyces sp. NPDC057638]|uniref:MerR family transcriptional regulator n=1 Tax=Streptomyces sp. NPDC057638 TaxID=3346190 RepID=UPI0036C87865